MIELSIMKKNVVWFFLTESFKAAVSNGLAVKIIMLKGYIRFIISYNLMQTSVCFCCIVWACQKPFGCNELIIKCNRQKKIRFPLSKELYCNKQDYSFYKCCIYILCMIQKVELNMIMHESKLQYVPLANAILKAKKIYRYFICICIHYIASYI